VSVANKIEETSSFGFCRISKEDVTDDTIEGIKYIEEWITTIVVRLKL
jgi:hypothetical protein